MSIDRGCARATVVPSSVDTAGRTCSDLIAQPVHPVPSLDGPSRLVLVLAQVSVSPSVPQAGQCSGQGT